MAQPDPQPKAWQLNLRAEASKYFLTELEIESDPADPAAQGLGNQPPVATGLSAGRTKPKLFAAGLGLGPTVPKFLRWDQPVEVHDVSLQDLEQQVSYHMIRNSLRLLRVLTGANLNAGQAGLGCEARHCCAATAHGGSSWQLPGS
jgi:hypothetical protein